MKVSVSAVTGPDAINEVPITNAKIVDRTSAPVPTQAVRLVIIQSYVVATSGAA